MERTLAWTTDERAGRTHARESYLGTNPRRRESSQLAIRPDATVERDGVPTLGEAVTLHTACRGRRARSGDHIALDGARHLAIGSTRAGSRACDGVMAVTGIVTGSGRAVSGAFE